MWMINGQVIRRKRHIVDGNGNKQRGAILFQWTEEALAEVGIKRFSEVRFDKTTLRSTGYSDDEQLYEVIREHTTEPIPAEIIERRERGLRIRENVILRVLLQQMKADKLGGKTLIPAADALLLDMKNEKDYQDALEAAMLAALEEEEPV